MTEVEARLEQEIDFAIEQGGFLGRIYKHMNMTPRNIDHAIAKGSHMKDLLTHQKLTNEQITQLIGNKGYRKLIIKFQNIDGWKKWLREQTSIPNCPIKMSRKILMGIVES